ncbi:TonB-dependent siderophore receptor [Pseudomaricurvus sp.]|uniref:TonB-dependent siderophore receptor n=1 Tax=Pseudomaricurvus sp. TaxID=2004510 RepID=UPI003F6C2BA3
MTNIPSHFSSRLLTVAILSACGVAPAIAESAPAASQLEEVVVVSQRQPYRGDVPLEQLPQQVQVIDNSLLHDVGAVELQSALDLAGGLSRQNSFGGLWDSFAIRGFAGDENLPSGYLINGFSGGRGFSGNRDVSNVESIEILKGPGSALFGRGEPGGTVNIVTKKPEFEREGYLRASAGRYDSYRYEGDYTDAITDTLAFRINGAYQESDSFRDTVETEKRVLSPSFLYAITDNTTLSYEMEYLQQEAPFDRGIVAVNGKLGTVGVNTFYGEPNDGPIEVDALGHQLVLQHDFNSNWSLLAGAGLRSSSFEGSMSQPDLAPSRQQIDTLGRVVRERRYMDFDADDKSGRVELNGKFNTGIFSHHLLLGADIYQYELKSIIDRWRVAPGATPPDLTYSVDLHNPVYGQAQPALGAMRDRVEKQRAHGFYLQDQIDLSERWKLLVGLRYDEFTQEVTDNLFASKRSQSQSQTSPRAGLVFEATDNLTLYASYSEGFRPNSGADFYGDVFAPEKSESYELGLKVNTLDDTLSGTLALFRMNKSNILTSDPNPDHAGYSVALGEAESEGVELDIHASLGDNTELMFSYAYVNAQTSNTVINADWGVEIPAGSDLINIPANSANLVLSQRVTLFGYPSTVGTSINYVDDRLGETIDPNYRLPGYTLVNLFGSIQPTRQLELSLNVDNLFDEEYYVSSYHKWWTMPGSPTTWTVAATYSF